MIFESLLLIKLKEFEWETWSKAVAFYGEMSTYAEHYSQVGLYE